MATTSVRLSLVGAAALTGLAAAKDKDKDKEKDKDDSPLGSLLLSHQQPKAQEQEQPPLMSGLGGLPLGAPCNSGIFHDSARADCAERRRGSQSSSCPGLAAAGCALLLAGGGRARDGGGTAIATATMFVPIILREGKLAANIPPAQAPH